MRIREISVKSALVRSGIPGVGFVINPYLGCGHGCRYCYATFMRKYSHFNRESRWGEFVEIKTNIAEVLENELARKRKIGTALLSSVCDPYQPIEKKYNLTRECLKLLRNYGWGIRVLTRSPLVIRDIDILTYSLDSLVGLSIPTDNDRVRKILEPRSPSIPERIKTLKQLREKGIRTWAFIAPVLPMDPLKLHRLISPHVEYVKIDSLNYRNQVKHIFREEGWEYALTPEYAQKTRAKLRRLFRENNG
ncbi:MAG: radical SAM protein [Candidatus Auribacterota bacterium]|nr:radical SAM protein [Candidatus Auribacterota bacterium]